MRNANSDKLAIALMLAFFAVAPAVLYPVFLMKVLCFALFACAFNLLIGFVGLLSFGHSMFFGFAAYVAGHMTMVGTIHVPYLALTPALHWERLVISFPPFSPELAILTGALVAAILGLVTGLLAIRRQGIYFAMVTLALAQMVYFACVQAPFTHGEDGIQGIPRRPVLGFIDITNDLTLYYFVLTVFAAGFFLIYRTIHSPFGQILKAIRENEQRTISLGYDVDRFKLLAFILSAALSGVAGATKAIVFQLASLTDVTWQMSGEVVLMTLVGGLGTVFGPVVGAAVIVTMQNYLKGFGEWVLVIQGAVFVITVLLFRRGIVGEIAALFERFQRKPVVAAASAETKPHP
jgi:branched-chain amino acid transport system permease protein